MCGTEKIFWGSWLTRNRVASCGCLQRDLRTKHGRSMGTANRTHGMTDTPTYHTWRSMRQRCSNPNSEHWKDYGERGIKVCARWTSFAKFFEDMGKRPEG